MNCRLCRYPIDENTELNYYSNSEKGLNNVDKNIILDIINKKRFHLKCLNEIECNFDKFEKIFFRFSIFECPKCGHIILTRGGKTNCTKCDYKQEFKNKHHCNGGGYEETNSIGDYVWKCPKCGREERRTFESKIDCNKKCKNYDICQFKDKRLKNLWGYCKEKIFNVGFNSNDFKSFDKENVQCSDKCSLYTICNKKNDNSILKNSYGFCCEGAYSKGINDPKWKLFDQNIECSKLCKFYNICSNEIKINTLKNYNGWCEKGINYIASENGFSNPEWWIFESNTCNENCLKYNECNNKNKIKVNKYGYCENYVRNFGEVSRFNSKEWENFIYNDVKCNENCIYLNQCFNKEKENCMKNKWGWCEKSLFSWSINNGISSDEWRIFNQNIECSNYCELKDGCLFKESRLKNNWGFCEYKVNHQGVLSKSWNNFEFDIPCNENCKGLENCNKLSKKMIKDFVNN